MPERLSSFDLRGKLGPFCRFLLGFVLCLSHGAGIRRPLLSEKVGFFWSARAFPVV
jgi:hypothetical protein